METAIYQTEGKRSQRDGIYWNGLNQMVKCLFKYLKQHKIVTLCNSYVGPVLAIYKKASRKRKN